MSPERGDVLDARYRLEEPLGPSTWRGLDLSLGRPVHVRLETFDDRASAHAQRDLLTRTGRVPGGGWVRVLDVGEDTHGRRRLVWAVREWVTGATLVEAVLPEPLDPDAATRVGLACTDALGAAWRAGLHVPDLQPDQVVLPVDDEPLLLGLDRAQDNSAVDETSAVRSVGSLLFAALTGHWPAGATDGLPAAGGRGRRVPRPREIRAGIPRGLDEVTTRALAGDIPTLATLRRTLDALPRAATLRARRARTGALARRTAWWVVPPVLIAVIGLTSWTLGRDLGRVPGAESSAAPAYSPPATSRAVALHALVWSHPPTVTSFDPQGDGTESADQVGLAVDQDPTTAWETERYRSGPTFGGRKHGVGLLLDLGQAATVRQVQLLLTLPGADITVFAGDRRPRLPTDLTSVATLTAAPLSSTTTLSTPVTARWWLLWITRLPADPTGGFREGVAEVGLLS